MIVSLPLRVACGICAVVLGLVCASSPTFAIAVAAVSTSSPTPDPVSTAHPSPAPSSSAGPLFSASPSPLPSEAAAPAAGGAMRSSDRYERPPLSFAELPLQEAQTRGVVHSPEVVIARARVDAASAVLARARGALGPSLVAAYTRNPQAGSTPQVPVIVQHSLNVGLQTTLGNVSSFTSALAQAEATYRGARFDELSATRAERSKVANLYFAALQARVSAQVRAEALALAQAQLQAARSRFAAGDAPRIDIVRAEVAVARTTAEAEGAQAADGNATEALAVETEWPSAALQRTSAGELPVVPPALLNATTAVHLALAQRADVQSAQSDLRATTAGLQAARVGLLPLVTLAAGYAHGVDTGQPISGPTLNANFELPLNASAASQIRIANATLTESQARLRLAERAVTLEISAAVRNLNAAMLATAASTKARVAAEEELRATEIGYRSGASSSLERSAAAATYRDARLAELNAIFNEATARAQLLLDVSS